MKLEISHLTGNKLSSNLHTANGRKIRAQVCPYFQNLLVTNRPSQDLAPMFAA